MSVKNDLLVYLRENVGNYVSGEEIATKLGCTRGAIWKAVKALEAEGYRITGANNKGYMLGVESDVLDEKSIYEFLGTEFSDIDVHIHKVIDSTNTEVRRLAASGGKEGTVVIANEQTAGRGRAGRSFYSPASTGIYMSFLLRPTLPMEESVRITTAAATAVAEAIEDVTGVDTGIKWVNDVYVGDRKVCGILTEASFSIEDNKVDCIILGIGINMYSPDGDFPDEIKDIAGYVCDEKSFSSKNKLIAEIIKRFMGFYPRLTEGSYLDGYKSRLMWKNEKINIISGDNMTPATLIDVDDRCQLVVRYDDGTSDVISSGEISIRRRK